jgi:hypothetical protein
MLYLIFMNGLRENAPWIVLVFLVCIAGLLIWAPKMSNNWKRRASRIIGSVLLGLLAVFSVPLVFFTSIDPPRQHFRFKSSDGSRVALLSHSETRDSSATEITVNADGCCSRYIAYQYYGDGEDYMGGTSVQWIDNHHLVIRYARDPSGIQECHSKVGDIVILCDPRPEPFPDGKPAKQRESK